MTIALVDGDIVAYRAAASAEKEEEDIALIRTDKTMTDILSEVGATGHKVFLSGSREDNFRTKICDQYKINRVGVPRPQHLEACKMFLITHYKAVRCIHYEADDALGMEQKLSGTIICSIDKDLLMIPGHHYNFVKKEYREVTEDQGLKSFYLQVLTGDTSDNVIGLKGIGPVKAAKILDPLLPEEYYDACTKAYEGNIERLNKNCKLLWIWRHPNQVWEPPL